MVKHIRITNRTTRQHIQTLPSSVPFSVSDTGRVSGNPSSLPESNIIDPFTLAGRFAPTVHDDASATEPLEGNPTTRVQGSPRALANFCPES
jgi:hypothetical protein